MTSRVAKVRRAKDTQDSLDEAKVARATLKARKAISLCVGTAASQDTKPITAGRRPRRATPKARKVAKDTEARKAARRT